jgi:hypothetical protein
MGSTDAYREVALRARQLLMQECMPSVEERKRRVLETASSLVVGDESQAVRELLADKTVVTDILFPLLQSSSSAAESVGLMDIFTRQLMLSFHRAAMTWWMSPSVDFLL